MFFFALALPPFTLRDPQIQKANLTHFGTKLPRPLAAPGLRNPDLVFWLRENFNFVFVLDNFIFKFGIFDIHIFHFGFDSEDMWAA